MAWGLLRTLFLILLGYYLIRWVSRVQARKQYREQQTKSTQSRSSSSSSSRKQMNLDNVGEYVDFEEVK